MQKVHIFVFLLHITHFTTTHCMISEFKYKPYTQQPNCTQVIAREHIAYWIVYSENEKLKPINDITIFREATKQERQGKCFNYAINQATGIHIKLGMYPNIIQCNTTINIENYFEQTQTPQSKDLVIYTADKFNRKIKHFAIIIDENTFASKFGKSTKIMMHRPFAVPNEYGNAISFWTLKQHFKDDKKNLLKTMRNEAEAFNKSFKK